LIVSFTSFVDQAWGWTSPCLLREYVDRTLVLPMTNENENKLQMYLSR
jgi:hypothetical protein